MIRIGGNEFRTLAQPIFVNGKHVREVWANGTQVYPETLHGNTIKIKGHIIEGRRFYRPERNFSCYDPWNSGEIEKISAYTETFSVSASFVAVFRYARDVGLREDGINLIPVCGTEFKSVKIPTEVHQQYGLPDSFYMRWDNEEDYMLLGISPICMPLSPLDGSPVPTVPTINFTDQDTSSLVDYKVLFKINMDPIPLSGEYLYTYYVPLSYYHTSRVLPNYSGMFSACDWNGQIFRIENQKTFTVAHPWIEDASMSCTIHFKPDFYRTIPSYLSVSFDKITAPGTLISNHHDSSKAIIRASIENLVNIPITDVLYYGMAEEAPEWALDVFESDLY